MSGKLSESGKKLLNDQLVIRALSPPGRDVSKWLARLMEIPVRTARFWAEKAVPVYRREEVGRRLLARYYAKRRWEEDYLLPELRKMAGLGNEDEIKAQASVVASAAADLVGLAAAGFDALADRAEAAINWLEE
jgi:hypothetical protein